MNIQSVNSATVPGATPTRQATPDVSPALRQAQFSQAAGGQPAEKQAVVQSQSAQASREQLQEAVQAMNDFIKPINNGIQFSLDDDTGKTIVKVIDNATKEVIKQFPSEEMLNIAKALDQLKGLLVQQKA